MQNAVESTAKVEDLRLSKLVPGFLRYGQYELGYLPETIRKYKDCLSWVVRYTEDVEVTSLNLERITSIKAKIEARGAKEARVASIVFALKSFLKYCQEELDIEVFSYRKIRAPRHRKREVIFLSNEEVEQFLESIPIWKSWNGKTPGKYLRLDALRFRTLVELLLGTGMRISEALSLNRDSIDFEKGEAKIIGKGSRERTVFFTHRCLEWVKFYIKNKTDNEPQLFSSRLGTRLNRADVSKLFATYKKKSGISKKITPHILRHTVATNLLFNGCPISHVKEILGHENLETTCRYYLGLDKTKAKEAHNKFLKF